MNTTKPDNTMDREEGDERPRHPLIPAESRVFGPPCENRLDWNAAVHQQRLLSTLAHPSSHEIVYTKWLKGLRLERPWSELNFLERAEWIQFYFDMNTQDLKVAELDSEEMQDKDEAEAKEYVEMAQRTIIPLMHDASGSTTYDTSGLLTDNASHSTPDNTSGATTANRSSSYEFKPLVPGNLPAGQPSMSQPAMGQFGPPMYQHPMVQSAPAPAPQMSMSQAPVYNQFGPPAPAPAAAPPMSQQPVYNQFPATGPVYWNQYRGPYQGPKKG
jgi:hypothetical protein